MSITITRSITIKGEYKGPEGVDIIGWLHKLPAYAEEAKKIFLASVDEILEAEQDVITALSHGAARIHFKKSIILGEEDWLVIGALLEMNSWQDEQDEMVYLTVKAGDLSMNEVYMYVWNTGIRVSIARRKRQIITEGLKPFLQEMEKKLDEAIKEVSSIKVPKGVEVLFI